MKEHGGLTIGGSILFHGLQQLLAFVLVVCIAILGIYSFAGVRTGADSQVYKETFAMNLFSEETAFDETSTFDQMLMSALQEIIRYNVAKSQLETDGNFDGNKVIDVRAFANRKTDLERGQYNTDFPEVQGTKEEEKYADKLQSILNNQESVTAEYYLEDLLKWERYGFYHEAVLLSEEEFVTWFGTDKVSACDTVLTEEERSRLQSYLSWPYAEDITPQAEVYEDKNQTEGAKTENKATESEEKEEKTYSLNQMHQALLQIMEENPGLVGGLSEANGEIYVAVNLLQERYQTVEGKSLLSVAKDWTEYQSLVSYVSHAVVDLSYNYEEYLDFKERYEAGKTNIVYAFHMTMMGENVSVSNLTNVAEGAGFGKDSLEELDDFFKNNYGRYVIYRPQTMTFESNTGIIEEIGLFEAFSNYQYAYPETAEIWLAVDTDYPVPDSFAEAAEAYETVQPFAYALFITAILAGVLWIVCFFFLSVMTGWRKRTEKAGAVFVLHWFDAIYTEVFLGLGLFLLYAGEILAKLLYHGISAEKLFHNRILSVVAAGAIGMGLSMAGCLFWYSLLRRIKGKVLLKDSLLYLVWKKVILRIGKAVKKAMLTTYDNGGVMLRCVLPIGGIFLLNFWWGFVCYRLWKRGTAFEVWCSLLLLCAADGIILALWFYNHLKRKGIVEGITRIRGGELDFQIDLYGMHGENKELAEAVNSIGDGIKKAVEQSLKDERLKADLITNVSHDIKTPLTSIINYVDLLKRERIEEEPVKGYIAVLDAKSQRLKQLTDDLVEASKISSGNITLIMEKINLTELLRQSLGEFSEKFEQKNLQVVMTAADEPVYIEADSRRIWRVMENLLNNAYKYALEGTRIYLDMMLMEEGKKVSLSLKNISAQRLNIKADELTERFIRGDVSRSTEGSGLGLSIAKNLTELQKGIFEIYLDGDLFKVTLTFPIYEEKG